MSHPEKLLSDKNKFLFRTEEFLSNVTNCFYAEGDVGKEMLVLI